MVGAAGELACDRQRRPLGAEPLTGRDEARGWRVPHGAPWQGDRAVCEQRWVGGAPISSRRSSSSASSSSPANTPIFRGCGTCDPGVASSTGPSAPRRSSRAWLDPQGRVEQTAKALAVHPQIVRHRLRQLPATSGADPPRPRRAFQRALALRVASRLPDRPTPKRPLRAAPNGPPTTTRPAAFVARCARQRPAAHGLVSVVARARDPIHGANCARAPTAGAEQRRRRRAEQSHHRSRESAETLARIPELRRVNPDGATEAPAIVQAHSAKAPRRVHHDCVASARPALTIKRAAAR